MLNRLKNDHKAHLPLNDLQLQLKKQVDDKVQKGEYSFEKVNCVCCGTQDFEQLAEKDRYGLYYSVVICKSCGLVQTNPRMTQSSYNSFYNIEYRRLYGGTHDPAKHFHKKQYPRGKNIFKFLSDNNLLPKKENPYVLDIGCGGGGAVLYFKEQGWRVKGIDLGKEFIDYGKNEYGLDLEIGMIRDLNLSEKPDLIIYSHVLEHILDLDQEIDNLKSICGKDTMLYIEVPGIKNLHQSYKQDLLLYFQNAHVYHYSLDSLKNILSTRGFVLLKGDEYIRSVFQLGSDTKQKIVNDFASVKSYLKRVERRRIVNSYLKQPIRNILSALNLKKPIKKLLSK